MPPSHRSIVPTVPGVPGWAAVLIAVTCTFIGFMLDSHSGNELHGTFSAGYVAGCVLAVLVVRYRALFTTMVLPPLLLFVAVPVCQRIMPGASSSMKIKDIVLDLAVPLVKHFPTMALATVLILVIGAVRILLDRRGRGAGAETRKPRTRSTRPGSTARGARTRSADPKDPARRRFRAGAAAENDSTPDTETTRGRRPAGRTAAGPPRVGANSRQGARTGQSAAVRQSSADRTPPAAEGGRRRRPDSAESQPLNRVAGPPAEGGRRRRPDNADSQPISRANPAVEGGRRRAENTDSQPIGRTAPSEGGRRRRPDNAAGPVPGYPGTVPQEGGRRRKPDNVDGPVPGRGATPPAEGGRRRKPDNPDPPLPGRASADRNPPAEGGRRRRAQPAADLPPHPRPNVRYRERDSGRIER